MKAAARLAVAIRNRHAARIVDQHTEEILLRDRRLEHEHGPEQAEEHDGQRQQPQSDQHDAIAWAIRGRHAAVRQQREEGQHRRARGDQPDHARGAPGEIALLKHERRVLEQEAKRRF